MTQQQIETLPINSRQYLSLALLMPGTTIDATRSFFATVNVGGSMTFNGTGNIVDGTINNWAEDGEPRQDLPEDAVEEFKVTNAGYKAEFGLATGGVVQVVTKSGANAARHAFEYFRNKSLNAIGHVRGRETGLPAPSVRRQRRRPDRAQSRAFLRGRRADRNRRVLHRAHRTAAVLLVGRRHVPAAIDAEPLLGRVDWQISNSQNFFARYLGRTS